MLFKIVFLVIGFYLSWWAPIYIGAWLENRKQYTPLRQKLMLTQALSALFGILVGIGLVLLP